MHWHWLFIHETAFIWEKTWKYFLFFLTLTLCFIEGIMSISWCFSHHFPSKGPDGETLVKWWHTMLQCAGAGLLLCIREASIWEILKTSDRDKKIILKIILHRALLWLQSFAWLPKPRVTRLEKTVGWLCHPSTADAAELPHCSKPPPDSESLSSPSYWGWRFLKH